MNILRRSFSFLWLALLCWVLFACSAAEEATLESLTPAQIYRQAESDLADGNLVQAAEVFEEIERIHPYSAIARKGTVMAAYAYGLASEYELSRSAARRFLRAFPGNENAAYAQYLVAMSYYQQMDSRGRDQSNTVRAVEELQRVIRDYPDSDYSKSAELKIDVATNHLASFEMEVGRYYLKHKNFTAAINRFQNVVRNFDTTSHVPEALHRMVEAYLSLGLEAEAQEAAAILGHNFRNSEWYESTFALYSSRGISYPEPSGTENLLSQLYRRTIKGEWL